MTRSPPTSAVVLAGLREALPLLGDRQAAPRSNASFASAARETRATWQRGHVASPLVATGHQATFRHPGILVKDLVASAIAERLGGTAIRLLVDQDVHPIGPLRVPLAESGERLRTIVIPCREPHADAPTGRRPPIALEAMDVRGGLAATIAEGVDRLRDALRSRGDAPSAARQVAAAMDELAPASAALEPPIAATELLATPIGLAMLEAIAREPRRCAESFNEALRIDPRAARPLAIAADRVEVPLWSIAWLRPRERVHLDPREPERTRLERLRDSALGSPSRLAPRGLLMTGMMRLVADLFVHGRGGWRYDRVTEAWFADWLGEILSPMAMASADWRLPLGTDAPSRGDLRRRWHDPSTPEGAGPGESKSAMLAAIAAAPRGSAARREAFLAMHRQFDADRRAAGLARPRAREEDPAAVAASREWAFPLHDLDSLQRLGDEAKRAVRMAADHVTG